MEQILCREDCYFDNNIQNNTTTTTIADSNELIERINYLIDYSIKEYGTKLRFL